MTETHSSGRLVVGDELDDRAEQLHRQFLLSLGQLMLVSRMHSLENAAVDQRLASLGAATEALCANGRRLRFSVEGEQMFLNRRRVSLSLGANRTVAAVVDGLLERGLSGFEMSRAQRPDEIRTLLAVLRDLPAGSSESDADLQRRTRAAGLEAVVLLGQDRVEADSEEEGLGDAERATLLYARTLVLLRESLRRWEDEDARPALGARARRTVQHVIALAERSPHPFLWLLHFEPEDEDGYLFAHSVNVAVLAVLVGQRLGLDRRRLCALAMAALYHDMGRIGLPVELVTKPGELTEEERRRIQRYPVEGVNLILRLGALNDEFLQRLIVVFEHNIDAGGYPRPHWPLGLHLFSRIVAIAHAYDAMTTRRSYRRAMRPDQAVRELRRLAGSRYDAELVRVFCGIVGEFPIGTLVRLDTGELGLVTDVDTQAPDRPWVKLVSASADGSAPADQGETVDLQERSPDGEYRRTIVGSEDPRAHGIRVTAHLPGLGG